MAGALLNSTCPSGTVKLLHLHILVLLFWLLLLPPPPLLLLLWGLPGGHGSQRHSALRVDKVAHHGHFCWGENRRSLKGAKWQCCAQHESTSTEDRVQVLS
jgi:hypothetical protein